MSEDGRVSKWMDGHGYGFIEFGNRHSIFVHSRELRYGRTILEVGERVTFDIEPDDRNPTKDQAVNVKGEYRDDPIPARRSTRNAPFCLDFQRGNCRYGDRCKFSHDGGSSRRSRSGSRGGRRRGDRGRSFSRSPQRPQSRSRSYSRDASRPRYWNNLKGTWKYCTDHRISCILDIMCTFHILHHWHCLYYLLANLTHEQQNSNFYVNHEVREKNLLKLLSGKYLMI